NNQKRRRAYSPLSPEQQQNTSNTPTHNKQKRKSSRHSRKNNSNKKKNVHKNNHQKQEETVTDKLPPLGDSIRIIPLGGVEEVGRNMTVVEYGDDIVVLDIGFKFRDEESPGIDFLLPNIKYLEENREKIRAIFITHGHLDHIGAIPYLMERLGNPPIYSRALTTVMIQKRQEEFPDSPKLQLHNVENEDVIKAGNLRVRFFSVTHTIPDSMGVIIETPYGNIIGTGDVKLDHVNGVPKEKEDKTYDVLQKEKNLLLMADSTNIENPGFSTPEWMVHESLEEIIKETKGRLIIGTFASQIERMVKIIEIAEKYGKKIVVEGRSMKNNIEIIRQVGVLNVDKNTIITAENMHNYPPHRIVALATGAQGDDFAALMRMSNKSHKHFSINKNDTILLSSSVIPGNENAVMRLKDNLSRQGAKIIHYKSADDFHVHATGHGYRGETEWVHKKIKPKFLIPVHGHHYMLRVHKDVAMGLGVPEENIVIPDNGMVIEIRDKGKKIVPLDKNVVEGDLAVDGFAVGNIQDVVIRDRKMLAEEGIFIVIASINTKTGKLKKSPDIVSRGFVYLRESQDLLQQTRLLIKKTVEDNTKGMNPIDFDFIKDQVAENVSRFLLQKTAKRPIVIPVILG
ncbi:MAG: ribonuclease J, partial [Candidatus Paceibacterota bacterium]